MDLNQITMVGRVAGDIQYTPAQGEGNSRVVFIVTVNKAYKVEGKSDHNNFRCVAWGKQADACAKYLKRGKQVTVSGEGNNYPVNVELKDGSKRTFNMFEIRCEKVRFGHDSMKNQQQQTPDGADLINLLKKKGLLDDKDLSNLGQNQNTNTTYGEESFYGDDVSNIFGDK